jgi:hypothetical protein
MRLFAFFSCLLTNGHKWTNSKKKRGFMTCTNCGVRRKYR